MKIFVYFFSLVVTAGSTAVLAQNTLPSSGNVGIGTTNPRTLLQVTGNKDYFVNHVIPGWTEDAQGINYLLLHLANDGTLMRAFCNGTGLGDKGGGWCMEQEIRY